MNKPFDYIAEANVTASNTFHGELISASDMQKAFLSIIEPIKNLDAIKKALFYGRHDGRNKPGLTGNCQGLPYRVDAENPNRGELLIHSIVGLVTEAGELLEMLNDVLFNGAAFDDVHFMEESGDCFWYNAIGIKQVDASFEDVQRLNINKLRTRFPNAFTEFDANNRDLFAERKVLEANNSPKDYAAGVLVGAASGKPTVRIENWFRTGDILIGDIFGHPRLGDEKDCRTSQIVNMDDAMNFCETKNTIYLLGTPYRSLPRSMGGIMPAVDTGD